MEGLFFIAVISLKPGSLQLGYILVAKHMRMVKCPYNPSKSSAKKKNRLLINSVIASMHLAAAFFKCEARGFSGCSVRAIPLSEMSVGARVVMKQSANGCVD